MESRDADDLSHGAVCTRSAKPGSGQIGHISRAHRTCLNVAVLASPPSSVVPNCI